MAFHVNRPGNAMVQKPKLSIIGKIVIAVTVIVVLISALIVYSTILANQQKNLLKEDVLYAIERSKVVCANALSVVGASEDVIHLLKKYSDSIDTKEQIVDKSTAAQEMITYTLSQVSGTQAQIDELNGSRNRILVALKKYNNQS